MSFAESYLGRLRSRVGSELLLVVGARVVVRGPDRRILLQLRTDFGVWGLPGGAVEPGESFETAARREFREECGVDAPSISPFGLACDPAHETATFPNGDQCQFVSMCFVGAFDVAPERLRGDPSETAKLDWFDADAAPTMLTTHSRTLEALRRFEAGDGFQLI